MKNALIYLISYGPICFYVFYIILNPQPGVNFSQIVIGALLGMAGPALGKYIRNKGKVQ